jgi:hypothetical protein
VIIHHNRHNCYSNKQLHVTNAGLASVRPLLAARLDTVGMKRDDAWVSKLMKNFIKCDRDGNGYITRDELESALSKNTEVMTFVNNVRE